MVGVILLDVGVQATHISNQSLIFSLVPEARSRLNTVYMTAYFIGGSVGSIAGGLAWTHFAWPGVCVVGLAFAAAGVSRPAGSTDASNAADTLLSRAALRPLC